MVGTFCRRVLETQLRRKPILVLFSAVSPSPQMVSDGVRAGVEPLRSVSGERLLVVSFVLLLFPENTRAHMEQTEASFSRVGHPGFGNASNT